MKQQGMAKLPSRRQLRVGEIVRHDLAIPLQHFPLMRSGRQSELMINVTEVSMSPDLKHARVYVRCFPQQNPPEDWLAQLQKSRKSLRSMLGKSLNLKFTPALGFVEDTSFTHADAIEKIISEDKQKENINHS